METTHEKIYVTAKTVTPDCMFGAAGYLVRNWGDHGYTIGVQQSSFTGGAVFGCRHSDGSEFFIYSDRYGCAKQVEWDGETWQDVAA